jgi:beta-phosphoglucomutase-like phosphatase (HAD superfamily)
MLLKILGISTVIKVILWDIDGTLTDDQIHKAKHKHLAEAAGYALSEAEGVALNGVNDIKTYDYLTSKSPSFLTLYPTVEKYTQACQDFFEFHAVNPHSLFKINARAGALECLYALKKLGIAQACVTSAPAWQSNLNVAALNIAEEVKFIQTLENGAQPKPSPDLYHQAFERMQALIPDLQKSDVLVIEDSLSGVEAAVNAGLQVIQCRMNAQAAISEKATFQVASYLELIVSLEKNYQLVLPQHNVEANLQNAISPLKFEVVTGSHLFFREKKKGLVLEVKQRKLFFEIAKNIEFLLKTHPLNPLLEEGAFINRDQRDQVGDYFITPVALTFLIASDIINYTKNSDANRYNINNIFIISNDYSELKKKLLVLNLKDGEDAKIVYIDNVHAVAFYLKNTAGQMRCFIADSQGNTYIAENISACIKECFRGVKVVVSPLLQLDHYSCFTFAKKAIQYFIKHGNDVFDHIDKVIRLNPGFNGLLSIENSMPSLLKFCQLDYSCLSEETLDTIVSQKAKLTLRDYFEENKRDIRLKVYNTAAIQAKYKYFARVNDLLSTDEVDADVLTVANQIYSKPVALSQRLVMLKDFKAESANPELRKQKQQLMLQNKAALFQPSNSKVNQVKQSKTEKKPKSSCVMM